MEFGSLVGGGTEKGEEFLDWPPRATRKTPNFSRGLPIGRRGGSGSDWNQTNRKLEQGEEALPAGVFFLPKMKLMAAGGRWSKTTTGFLGSERRLRFRAGEPLTNPTALPPLRCA